MLEGGEWIEAKICVQFTLTEQCIGQLLVTNILDKITKSKPIGYMISIVIVALMDRRVVK